MDEQQQAALKLRFEAAIDQFVGKVRGDVNVIAVVVSGSVAYDVVWEKSDIDTLVIVRDQILNSSSLSIVEDGITFNVALFTRSDFKRKLDREMGGSMFQAYLAHGKIVYTSDESLYEYFDELRNIGADDQSVSMLHMVSELIGVMHKSQKWLTARKDLAYAQYYLLRAAEPVAHIELLLRGVPTSRSAIQKALVYNPEMMDLLYRRPMTGLLSQAELEAALARLDAYIEEKMPQFSRPVLEYLSDAEIKTATMIAKRLNTNVMHLIDALDYLAEKGLIDKVSQTIKLTPKSRASVEEIGFLAIHP